MANTLSNSNGQYRVVKSGSGWQVLLVLGKGRETVVAFYDKKAKAVKAVQNGWV